MLQTKLINQPFKITLDLCCIISQFKTKFRLLHISRWSPLRGDQAMVLTVGRSITVPSFLQLIGNSTNNIWICNKMQLPFLVAIYCFEGFYLRAKSLSGICPAS